MIGRGRGGGRGGRALGHGPPLVDGVHLGGEELQAAAQVALLAQKRLLVAQRLAVLVLQGLWEETIRRSTTFATTARVSFLSLLNSP